MLTNCKVTIQELQRISEEATIRDWVQIGTENLLLVPPSSSGSEMKAIADTYQIMGKPYQAYTETGTIIKEGHRLVINDDYYEVKGRSCFTGSANVDSCVLILEKLKE